MNEKMRELRAKGEFDYDYAHDILFFKVKDREYERSFELDNFVLDVDGEGFIVGFQIFQASEYFSVQRKYLQLAMGWELQAKAEKISESESRIEIRLIFQVVIRNKILQPEPIITHNIQDSLENAKVICVPVSK
jgi:uncharacterized protein YuzE